MNEILPPNPGEKKEINPNICKIDRFHFAGDLAEEILKGNCSKEDLLKLAYYDTKALLKNFDDFKSQPYAEEIMALCVRINHFEVARNFKIMSHEKYAERTLLLIAENHASYILTYVVEGIKHKEYYKRIMQICLDKLIANDDFSTIAIHADSFTDLPNAKKVFTKLAQDDFYNFFSCLNKLEKLPYVWDLVQTALEKDPEAAFFHHKKFEQSAMYEPILERALHVAIARNKLEILFQYSKILKHFSSYKNNAEKIVKHTIKEEPEMAVKYGDPKIGNIKPEELKKAAYKSIEKLKIGYTGTQAIFDKFEIFEKQGYAKDLLDKIISTDPSQVIYHYEKYKNNSYAKKILKNAVYATLDKEPKDLKYIFDKFKKEPYSKEVSAAFIQKGFGKDFIQERDNWKDMPWDDLLKAAVDDVISKNPSELIFCLRNIQDQPYYKASLEKIFADPKKSPKTKDILSFAKQLKDLENYEAILKKAVDDAFANDRDFQIFAATKQIVAFPWGEEVIKKANKKENAYFIFANINKFKHKPYSREVIEKAASESPEIVFKEHNEIRNLPYRFELIKKAARLCPIALAEEFKESHVFSEEEKKSDEVIALFNEIFPSISIAEEGKEITSKIITKEDLPIKREILEIKITSYNYFVRYNNVILTDFADVFFTGSFQEILEQNLGKFTYMNAFSLAITVREKLQRENKNINDENVKEAARGILNHWERIKTRELFGPNTKLILFTHEEPQFKNEEIIAKIYKRSGGKDENILHNEKGVKMTKKELVLEKVKQWHAKNGGDLNENYLNRISGTSDELNLTKILTLYAIANTKGNTTILFDGHGSPENWAFAQNQADNLNHSLESKPRSINYKELGDALIASNNIENFNLIGATCYSYDYLINLFGYMESKGEKRKPYLSISTSNKGKPSWNGLDDLGSLFLNALYKSSQERKPMLGEAFFKAEGLVADHEDPAIFIGQSEAIPNKSNSEKTTPATNGDPNPEIKSEKDQLNDKTNQSPPKYYLELASTRFHNKKAV